MQKGLFLAGEGDAWYERNRAAAKEEEIALFARVLKDGQKVLEIGCSDGKNLSFLCSRVAVACAGIDPSEKAIAEGKKRHPDFDLRVGTAESLPFEKGSFDMVVFGFCLYLADREDLAKIVYEADRVLRNGGMLGVLDFDTPYPIKKSYSHLEGVDTYKLDYSRLFLAFPHYSLAEKVSLSHDGMGFHPDPDERVSSVLLYKNHEGAYFEKG